MNSLVDVFGFFQACGRLQAYNYIDKDSQRNLMKFFFFLSNPNVTSNKLINIFYQQCLMKLHDLSVPGLLEEYIL